MKTSINNFINTLKQMENHLYSIGRYEREISLFGLRSIARMSNFKDLIDCLDRFHIELDECLEIIRIVDRPRFDAIRQLLKETKLEGVISQFAVRLRLAFSKEPPDSSRLIRDLTYMLARLVTIRKSNFLFPDSELSFPEILASVNRIKNSFSTFAKIHNRIGFSDDEIFKPSNIKIDFVAIQIDTAISSLEDMPELKTSESQKIIEYLQEAKEELTVETPSWKKIVGALVIAATLIGGIAAASDAYENINKAITHVLGTAVELNEKSKNPLTLPKSEKEHGNGSGEKIVEV